VDIFKKVAIENGYEFSQNDGIMYYAIVTYTGDKDDTTFEDLEGRRYYFDKLMKLIISTTYSYDIKKS